MKLVDVNRAVHHELDAALVRTGAAVMARDTARARALLDAFVARLSAHMQVEDSAVLPRYAAHAQDTGAGAPKHVASDHLILAKHLERCVAVLAALPDEPTVREAFLALDPLLKLHGTLEHHDEREERFVYPLLDLALDDHARAALARLLATQLTATSDVG